MKTIKKTEMGKPEWVEVMQNGGENPFKGGIKDLDEGDHFVDGAGKEHEIRIKKVDELGGVMLVVRGVTNG